MNYKYRGDAFEVDAFVFYEAMGTETNVTPSWFIEAITAGGIVVSGEKTCLVMSGVAVPIPDHSYVARWPSGTLMLFSKQDFDHLFEPRSHELSLDEYGRLALETAIYPNQGNNLVYPALGIVGEAGEVAEQVKKSIRDDGGIVTPDRRASIAKEIGDVLWYVSAAAREIGYTLGEIARMNLAKLRARKESGRLSGSGSDR